MNVWKCQRWKKYYNGYNHRTGLRVVCDIDLDKEVARSIKEFVKWLRKQYYFPQRIRMYVKSSRRIKTKDGSLVCGTFFRPANRREEPYIRIATGDFGEMVQMRCIDDALAAILWTIAHEITHYYQWVNDLNLTLIGEERQATNYANRLLLDYANTREHP